MSKPTFTVSDEVLLIERLNNAGWRVMSSPCSAGVEVALTTAIKSSRPVEITFRGEGDNLNEALATAICHLRSSLEHVAWLFEGVK